MRIKNWAKFQHFKDRRPPWVKLYRDILDDPEWHELDAEAAKILVMLWLLASEDETQEGKLPDAKTIAFRIRMPINKVNQALIKLEHWLYHSDINLISERYQHGLPETETETETKKETETDALDGFDEFWMIYDKKVEKPQAEKSWKRIKPSVELQLTIYAAARQYVTATPDKKYRKNPSTWLNNHCWNDEVVTEQQQRKVGFFGTLMNFGESQNEQLPNPFAPRLDG